MNWNVGDRVLVKVAGRNNFILGEVTDTKDQEKINSVRIKSESWPAYGSGNPRAVFLSGNMFNYYILQLDN